MEGGDGDTSESYAFAEPSLAKVTRGDTITFEPEIPDGCSTFRCAWSVSVAYPGKRWKRVN
jgi:hypothetical protein